MKKGEITKEQIQEWLKELWKDKVVHSEWEEDGRRYSSWTFEMNGRKIMTGDGGAKMILDAIKDKFGELE